MTPKGKSVKVVDDDDYDVEEEEDEYEEESFNCRDCKKEIEMGDGDDLLLLCDKCLKKYDEDKIWEDFEDDKIKEEELGTISLSKYKK